MENLSELLNCDIENAKAYVEEFAKSLKLHTYKSDLYTDGNTGSVQYELIPEKESYTSWLIIEKGKKRAVGKVELSQVIPEDAVRLIIFRTLNNPLNLGTDYPVNKYIEHFYTRFYDQGLIRNNNSRRGIKLSIANQINAPANEIVEDIAPLDSRKVIELLYWMFASINSQPSTPVDLFWANERYKENWGLKGELAAYSMGDTLHPDIPEILHELEASGYVLDTPQNMINSPIAGRFEEMEKRNGGRISRYPPFGFNLYISEPGFNHVLWSMRQGLLRDAIRETPGGLVIDWAMVEVVANKLPSLDLLEVPYKYKSSVVHFDMPDFIIWVARRSENLPVFPVQEGNIILESLPVPWPIEDASLKILELNSWFRNLEGSSPVPYQTIIRFEINRIRGSERTGDGKKTKSPGYLVTIECYHQAVRPFFDELVREFEENWKDDAAATPQPTGINIDNFNSRNKQDTTTTFVNWLNGIVAILNPDGVPIGTGFVISKKGYIATSTHLLRRVGADTSKHTTIRIRFKATQTETIAHIDTKWCSPLNENDVTLLLLTDHLPDEVESLPLVSSQDTLDHKIRSWGYPDGNETEGWAGKGEILGETRENGYRRLQFSSKEITRGYSGGPLWDDQLQGVIGVVKRGSGGISKPQEAGLAVPSEALVTLTQGELELAGQSWQPPPELSPAAVTPSTITPSTMTLAQFNELVRKQFNESELKDVCLTLQVDYELLPGNSKADKSRELILYLQRRGRVPHLLTLVKQERPHITWPDTISD